MPIFEYKCNDCGTVSEILQLPGYEGELKCSVCGSLNLTKLISAPFVPSSVGRPANDDVKCPDMPKREICPAAGRCDPGSCCAQKIN